MTSHRGWGIYYSTHKSSISIDLYEIHHIFYTQIIHSDCLQTLTEYIYIYIHTHTHTHIHTHIYIYIYIYIYIFIHQLRTSRESSYSEDLDTMKQSVCGWQYMVLPTFELSSEGINICHSCNAKLFEWIEHSVAVKRIYGNKTKVIDTNLKSLRLRWVSS